MTSTEKYTREYLIDLCEKAIVPETKWRNRDSASAQKGVGECWALLKAGCEFRVITEGQYLQTNLRTIWLELYPRGFNTFETGDEGRESDSVTIYLPTELRLAEADGSDWY